jgi:hypothetical protein
MKALVPRGWVEWTVCAIAAFIAFSVGLWIVGLLLITLCLSS